MLFEVALVKQPTEKEKQNGVQETLLMPPTPVIADDQNAASVIAVSKNKDNLPDDLSRVKVLVRPFA